MHGDTIIVDNRGINSKEISFENYDLLLPGYRPVALLTLLKTGRFCG